MVCISTKESLSIEEAADITKRPEQCIVHTDGRQQLPPLLFLPLFPLFVIRLASPHCNQCDRFVFPLPSSLLGRSECAACGLGGSRPGDRRGLRQLPLSTPVLFVLLFSGRSFPSVLCPSSWLPPSPTNRDFQGTGADEEGRKRAFLPNEEGRNRKERGRGGPPHTQQPTAM